MMIEIMATRLTGTGFSYQVAAEAPEGVSIFRTGQLYILLDPTRDGNDAYADRISEFVEMPEQAGWDHIPARSKHRRRDKAMEKGILVTNELAALLEK